MNFEIDCYAPLFAVLILIIDLFGVAYGINHKAKVLLLWLNMNVAMKVEDIISHFLYLALLVLLCSYIGYQLVYMDYL